MKAGEDYRPGNVIIGGGGRDVPRAPADAGIERWPVVRGERDIGEVYVEESSEWDETPACPTANAVQRTADMCLMFDH